jgi:GDP-L-fucose synthase
MRDFIHIDDCVRGVLHTVDAIDDGGALNLSTGILTSFAEFAKLAAKVLGFEAEVVGLSSQPEGVFARGGDTTKQERLGFRAEIPLERGIARALDRFSLETV